MSLFSRRPSVDTTQVLAALARVVHPEQRRDIVQVKMVKELVVEKGNVAFTIQPDAVGAPIRSPRYPIDIRVRYGKLPTQSCRQGRERLRRSSHMGFKPLVFSASSRLFFLHP